MVYSVKSEKEAFSFSESVGMVPQETAKSFPSGVPNSGEGMQ